ncbi:MAG TPA: MATE family efflux transporter [Clostridiales bacterium]|nr:MATE family efflux transporter [Clostridiales bacterium]
MAKDMTVGREWKLILLFSLPVMIGNLLQQLYNTVDGIVVGNYVSESALAAVGSSGTLAMVFIAVAIGLGNGAGIMISQLYGAKRMDELKNAVSTSLILLVSIGAILSVLGFVFTGWLLNSLLRIKNSEILQMAIDYFSIYALGIVLQFAYNTIASILRAVGDSKATLIFLGISGVANLLLDLVFVIQFKWGVAGAAIATVISQAASTVVSAIYMFKRYPMFRFKRGEFVFDPDKCKLCLRLGIPTTLQHCVLSFGNVLMQRLVNSFGQATMAAFTVGTRIENYATIPVLGFNIGASNFTGQNMGAGNIGRIKKGWRGAVTMSFCVCVVITTLTYTLAAPLASLFGVEGETLTQSVEFIRFLSFFYLVFSFYIVTSGVLQGAGDVLFTSLCTATSLFVRVTCSYTMAYVFDVGYSSVWKAVPVGWTICIMMVFIRFFGGKWQTKGIVKREVQTE